MPFPCLKIDQHLAISGFSLWDEMKWNKKRRLFWFFTQTNNKQCCVRRQNQSKGRNYANVPREEWRRCWWEDDRWPPPEVLSIETDHAGLHCGRQQGAILSYAVSAVMCAFTLILGTIRVSGRYYRRLVKNRAGGGSQTFFSMYGNHLPSLSGVHGLKDFLHSDHLLEWFDVRSYTYGSVLKSNF